MQLTQRLVLAGATALIIGCSSTAQRPPRDLAGGAAVPKVLPAAEPARMTDGAIRRDLGYLESLQARIKALNDAGEPAGGYALAKAQCWLEWSLDEYHDNDRTGAIEEAAGESLKIIDALERGQSPELATRIVATSTRLREDLWARAQQAREHAGFQPPRRCANVSTACLEVKLVEAGHDYRETGWRHARAALIEAEQLAELGAAELRDCAPLPPPPVAPLDGDDDGDGISNSRDQCANTPPPARVDSVGCEIKAEIRLPGVNFETNRATLLPGSSSVLDDAVATLKRYPQLRIEVAGHTDASGSDAYNLALSQRRAAAVRDYLLRAGVANALTARGYGESQPLADNRSDAGRLQNRRVVLRILSE
jgi:outer membrane protein OmpA-like peptidoglycan-associated protein